MQVVLSTTRKNHPETDTGWVSLKHYLQNQKLISELTLGNIKQIIIQTLRFCETLGQRALRFVQNLQESILLLKRTEKDQVYFKVVQGKLSQQLTQEDQATKAFRKQTKFESSLKIKDGYFSYVVGLLFVKMLFLRLKGDFSTINNQNQEVITKMLNHSLTIAQSRMELQRVTIKKEDYRIQTQLITKELNENQTENQVSLAIKNNHFEEQFTFLLTQKDLKEMCTGYESILQLFCDLTMKLNQSIQLAPHLQILVYDGKEVKHEIKLGNFEQQKIEQSFYENFDGKHLFEITANFDSYPYNCIGILLAEFENQRDSNGTCMLISKKIVLTSAHTKCRKYVLPKTQDQNSKSGKKHFRIKQANANNIIIRFGKRQYKVKKDKIAPKYKSFNQVIQKQNDYAVLVLQEEVDRPFYLKIAKNYKTKAKIFSSGMSDFIKPVVGRSEGKKSSEIILEDTNSDALIYHDMHTEPGDSGSPIYVQITNNVYVIGIHCLYDPKYSRQGVKINDDVANFILQIQKNSQDQEDRFTSKTIIEYQKIVNDLVDIEDTTLNFIELFLFSLNASQQQIFSFSEIKQTQSYKNQKEYVTEQLLFRQGEQLYPTVDQAKKFEAQLLQILFKYVIPMGLSGNQLLSQSSLGDMKDKFTQSTPIKSAIKQVLNLFLQHNKITINIISTLLKDLQSLIKHCIQCNNNLTSKQLYAYGLYKLLQILGKLFPTFFSLFQHFAVRGQIFNQNGQPKIQQTEQNCFHLLRGFLIVTKRLNYNQPIQIRNLIVHQTIFLHEGQNFFFRKYHSIYKYEKQPFYKDHYQFPEDIQSPWSKLSIKTIDWYFVDYVYFSFQTQIEQEDLEDVEVKKMIQISQKGGFQEIQSQRLLKSIASHHKSIGLLSRVKPGFTIKSFIDRGQSKGIPGFLFAKIIYQTLKMMIKLHERQLNLLSPLQFTVVIQKNQAVKLIFMGEWFHLKKTLALLADIQQYKQLYNRYYPVQKILCGEDTLENRNMVDFRILQLSAKRLEKFVIEDGFKVWVFGILTKYQIAQGSILNIMKAILSNLQNRMSEIQQCRLFGLL